MSGLLTLTPAEQQTRRAFDFEHRRFEDARYLHMSPALVETWLADVQLPAGYFRGRRALDIGCGTGRWTYAMARLGAHVVAVDFSDAAVEQTRAMTRGFEHVEVVKASLWHLPFRPGEFDFVVCWGVLHHTRNTAEAFRAIAPLVRRDGYLHVMVYERRNPIKVLGTEVLRMIFRRLSAETRYRLCGRLIIKNRVLFHLLRGWIACLPQRDLTEQLDARTAQFGLYDWYSPRYNHLHSTHEVRAWFAEAGFGDLHLATPVKYHAPLDVWRYGECGGSITVRGKRITPEPEAACL